jgi:hypothetical protein
MTIRSAEFTIYTETEILHNQLNYVRNIVAVCVLNALVEVFTVYETRVWFQKPQYQLRIQLRSCLTGNYLGYKYFDTQEEAIKYGSEYIKQLFPEVAQ